MFVLYRSWLVLLYYKALVNILRDTSMANQAVDSTQNSDSSPAYIVQGIPFSCSGIQQEWKDIFDVL
jgi:hypothetical protein